MSYAGHEAKVYYVTEDPYGVCAVNPDMLGFEIMQLIEPSVDPANIKLYGSGSRDLASINAGLRKTGLKLQYVVPGDDILSFIQHVTTLYSLTIEVVYDKDGSLVVLRHVGSKFDKLTVECSMEDVLKATAELICKDIQPMTLKMGNTYTDFGGVVPFNDTLVQKGTADGSNLAELEVLDWRFDINNNLKRVGVIRDEPESLLTADASSGQKVVTVADGTKFKRHDKVFISDDLASEANFIDTISGNDLTMYYNLEHTYTIANNAFTRVLCGNLLKYLQHRQTGLTGSLTMNFENRSQYWDIVGDAEFSLKFLMGSAKYALFKNCKWDTIGSPTPATDLVAQKLGFTARTVAIG